jgi:hypothetical protein
MKQQRGRLIVERLEGRDCPSASAVVNPWGDLVVRADTPGPLSITETAQGSFTVQDATTTVKVKGVTRDVDVFGTSGDDNVTVDLGGFKVPRDLNVWLGAGNNSLAVKNGTVAGFLEAHGGSGNDAVTLGGSDQPFKVGLAAAVYLDGGTDSLTVDGTAANKAVLGALVAYNPETVTLGPNSQVNGPVVVAAGYTSQTNLSLGGAIGGGVAFYGGLGADSLTLQKGATVGGSLAAFTGGGNDTVDLEGSVAGSVLLATGAGDDQVTVGGTVGRDVFIDLGDGNDSLTFTGTVGTPGSNTSRVLVDAGAGNDSVTLAAGSQINGTIWVFLGAGDDTMTVDNAATFVKAFLDGGSNTTAKPGDTFVGNPKRAGLTLTNFETFA